jgi:hypothetical protein
MVLLATSMLNVGDVFDSTGQVDAELLSSQQHMRGGQGGMALVQLYATQTCQCTHPHADVAGATACFDAAERLNPGSLLLSNVSYVHKHPSRTALYFN